MKRALWLGLAVAGLSGCPGTGIVCRAGTDRCGNGCADFSSDNRNCGACGRPCLGSQVCSSGACVCRQGTELCNGDCAVFDSDPQNCGACGRKCGVTDAGSLEVCFTGTCGEHCPVGYTRCGGSCVQITSDALNCGACGRACPDSQSCHRGACTWDMVAACLTTGQVAGLQSGSDRRGPLAPMGSGPISLAPYGDLLLVADTLDNRLLQARPPGFEPAGDFNTTGAGPNHVLVSPPFVYVVNSIGHTVQVLAPAGDGGCPPVMQPDAGCAVVGLSDGGVVQPLMGDGGCFFPAPTDGGCAEALLADGGLGPFVPEEDAGCFTVPPVPMSPPCVLDGGLKLATVGAVDTGMNTFPQAAAKMGTALWVPLWGDRGANAAAGQKVLKIEVSNPASPSVVGTVDLTRLNLMPFDAGFMPVPRPYDIIELAGKLYVPLNNTTAGLPLVPQGPGLLARIDAMTSAADAIDLGAACLNPLAVVPANGKLFVSCGGAAHYDASFNLVSNSGYGVAVVDPAGAGTVVGRWVPECPAAAGCSPILPSRLAVRDGRVYLGDQSGGRIFVGDVKPDFSIAERRGYGASALSGPVQACGVPSGGFSNVADIISLP